jgi:hypothetical protein
MNPPDPLYHCFIFFAGYLEHPLRIQTGTELNVGYVSNLEHKYYWRRKGIRCFLSLTKSQGSIYMNAYGLQLKVLRSRYQTIHFTLKFSLMHIY